MLTVGGVTVTVATGTGMTFIVAEPVFPSTVAVIVAVPIATAVTTPVCDTVAMPVLSEFHERGRPVRTFPLTSFNVATSVTVCPITTLGLGGASVMVFTGAAVTDTVVDPLFPSLVAVIVACPAPTPVMRPADDTVAIAGALVAHVTTRFVTISPLTSLRVTVGVADCETTSGMFDGETVTVPTGTAVTVTVDDPLFPSAVAVIVTVPGATPVTTPEDDTVAVAAVPVVHVTGRSVTTVPFSSFTVAVNGVV